MKRMGLALAGLGMLAGCGGGETLGYLGSYGGDGEMAVFRGWQTVVLADREIDAQTASLCVSPFNEAVDRLVDAERAAVDAEGRGFRDVDPVQWRRQVGVRLREGTARAVQDAMACGASRGYGDMRIVAVPTSPMLGRPLPAPEFVARIGVAQVSIHASRIARGR